MLRSLVVLLSLQLLAVSVHGLVLPREASDPLRNEHDIVRQRVSVGKSSSNRKVDPVDKYFHESSFDAHYDGRFANKAVPYDQRRPILVSLVRAYLSTMREIGVETWIMHGSLLGWWWNKRIMPWDTDLDVMVAESSMEHLAKYSNMTVYHVTDSPDAPGRDYMLEINPHFRNLSNKDTLNKIDARFIDMSTGLFIDMTTLHYNATAEALGKAETMMAKDNHHYRKEDIFPLRETIFEGVNAMIPYGYAEVLIEEYGPKSLYNRDFEGHHFDQVEMDWIPVAGAKMAKGSYHYRAGTSKLGKQAKEKQGARTRKTPAPHSPRVINPAIIAE